jgi:AP endonuclease-2
MKIMARETNYGTRVDYILITPGLLPWIKHGDIQPSLKGSDHCPIYIDLHDSITDATGQILELKVEMSKHILPGHVAPRLASCNWDEYSGKQKLLSSFFGKGKVVKDVKSETASDVVASAAPANPPLSSEPITLPQVTTAPEPATAKIPATASISSSQISETSVLSSPSQSNVTKRKKPPVNDINPAASDAYDSVIKKRQKSKGSSQVIDLTKDTGKTGQPT